MKAMLKWVSATLALNAALMSSAMAFDRVFPPDTRPCQIISTGLPAEGWIKTNEGTSSLAPSLTIRDQQNRFITLNQLPVNVAAQCQFDESKTLKRIWLLTLSEAKAAVGRK